MHSRKSSNFQNFCWMIRTQSLFLNYFYFTSSSWLSITSSSSQCCWTRMASQVIECYQFRCHFTEPQKWKDRDRSLVLSKIYSKIFWADCELIPELTSLQCNWKGHRKGKGADETPLLNIAAFTPISFVVQWNVTLNDNIQSCKLSFEQLF